MISSRRDALAILFSWVLFWAMFAGLAHVGFVAANYFALGKFAGAERDFVWMVPLGYLLTLAALSIPAGILVALAPSSLALRIAMGVVAFFGTLGILLLFPRLYPAASVILAAGIGARASALVRRFSRGALRAGLLVAAGLTTIGLAAGLERKLSERQALGALAPARDGTPNVILVILDTVRAANMSFLGYARETTPRLSRLAARGTVFEQAYSTAPWTLPSHAAFFTGRYGSQLSTDWQVPLDKKEPTVAEIFQKHGYATAGFVANRYYTAWDSGLDRGFIHYDDSRITREQIMLSTTFAQTNLMRSIVEDHSRHGILRSLRDMDLGTRPFPSNDLKTAEVVAAAFLQWLPASGDRPFFAFLNLFDAHRPYTSPHPSRFAGNPEPIDLYDAAIFHMDSVLGTLFDSLDARGTLANTIVVVTSDHGEDLGEHGLQGHGRSLYRTELHVPLLIFAPRSAPAGMRIDKAVTLRDLPATLLDLAGIDGNGFPGVSLRETWKPSGAKGSEVISEITERIRMEPNEPASRGSMRSGLDDSTHFILNGDGVEELYAWRVDPGEEKNIANAPQSRSVIAAMRSRIDRVLEAR